MNLESHTVVDLLPDRQAETAAAWMYQHPDIFVVSRDRGSAYASAASEAAPQATQCADRFHIVKNLTEATQVLLARCQAEILAVSNQERADGEELNKPLISIEEWRPPEPSSVEKVRLARRAGSSLSTGSYTWTAGDDPKRNCRSFGPLWSYGLKMACGWDVS